MRGLRRLSALLGIAMMIVAAPVAAQQAEPTPSAEHINAIGNAMIEAAGTADARILLYAEIRGSDLLFETRYLADGTTEARRALPQNDVLLQSIADAWREAHAAQGDAVWRVMIYKLDHGRVNGRLLYQEQYDPAVSFDDRYVAELGWLRGAGAE